MLLTRNLDGRVRLARFSNGFNNDFVIICLQLSRLMLAGTYMIDHHLSGHLNLIGPNRLRNDTIELDRFELKVM